MHEARSRSGCGRTSRTAWAKTADEQRQPCHHVLPARTRCPDGDHDRCGGLSNRAGLTGPDLIYTDQCNHRSSFDSDRSRAIEDIRLWAALALSPDEKTGVEDPLEMERRADALSAERSASRWIVSSDPDEHVAAIQRYVDMGFRHLVFHARARN